MTSADLDNEELERVLTALEHAAKRQRVVLLAVLKAKGSGASMCRKVSALIDADVERALWLLSGRVGGEPAEAAYQGANAVRVKYELERHESEPYVRPRDEKERANRKVWVDQANYHRDTSRCIEDARRFVCDPELLVPLERLVAEGWRRRNTDLPERSPYGSAIIEAVCEELLAQSRARLGLPKEM
jgi:hypothetical protein